MATVAYLALTTNNNISDAQKIRITKDKMAFIESSILNFRNIYKRLPCPSNQTYANGSMQTYSYDSNSYNKFFDDEFIINTSFTVNTHQLGNECLTNSGGGVPTRALGISSDYMVDGWGRRFVYKPSPNVCGNYTTAIPPNCTASSYKNNEGNLTVKSSSNSSNIVETTTAAYVLVSYGPNGFGAPTIGGSTLAAPTSADELQNTSQSLTYIADMRYSNFDDIVIYKTKSQIEYMAVNNIIVPFTVSDCQNNSLALQSINYNSSSTAVGTKNIRENLTSVEKKDANITTNCDPSRVNTFNCGDEAVIDMMWAMQDACFLIYPSTLPALLPSSSKQCPGGGSYNSTTDSCTCNNTSWSGSC
jgi:hypothetical protein